jgi:hypothetical protein
MRTNRNCEREEVNFPLTPLDIDYSGREEKTKFYSHGFGH